MNRHQHMNRAACIASAALVLAAVTGARLHAHDFWLQPHAFAPSAGDLVALHLLVGEEMIGDPIRRDEASIARFVVRHGNAERPIPGREGDDPAGILRVPGNGLLSVGYESHPRAIELPRAKFDAYLGEEGLDAVKGVLARSTSRPSVARERFSRCAKALLASGEAVPGQRDQALGLTLELVAGSNPYTATAQQELPFTLLYKGAPRPDALVIAINRDDPSAKLSARSDAGGRVRFRFPRGGVWLVKAVHMVPLPAGSDADWESFWASLTFELPS
jgi:uncharacterized GH25 family protein